MAFAHPTRRKWPDPSLLMRFDTSNLTDVSGLTISPQYVLLPELRRKHVDDGALGATRPRLQQSIGSLAQNRVPPFPIIGG